MSFTSAHLLALRTILAPGCMMLRGGLRKGAVGRHSLQIKLGKKDKCRLLIPNRIGEITCSHTANINCNRHNRVCSTLPISGHLANGNDSMLKSIIIHVYKQLNIFYYIKFNYLGTVWQ